MLNLNKVATFTYIIGILFIAFIIRLNKLDRVGYINKEFYEVPLLSAYHNDPNPFNIQKGSQKIEEISQSRLPYYINTLFFFVSLPHKMRHPALLHARFTSVLFGILCVFLTYFLAKDLYNASVGIFTSFLVAISTYHAGFSRFALTTGDIYVSFFTILSLWLFFKGIKENNQRFLLFSGIATGLACASKFTALLLIPVFFLFLFFYNNKKTKFSFENMKNTKINLLLISLFNIFAASLLIFISILWYGRWFNVEISNRILSIFLVSTICYMFGLFIIIFRISPAFEYAELPMIFVNVILMTVIFTFIGSPVHLKPELMIAATERLREYTYNNNSNLHRSFFYIIEIIFFKLGFPFNVAFFSGLFYTLLNIKDKTNLFLFITIAVFLVIFSFATVVGAFYLMPIMPLITAVSVNEVSRYFKIIKTKKIKISLIFILCISVALQLFNILKISPYYHLDGFKLGRNFIGSNKLSFVTYDGIKDCVEWIEKHVPDNSRVAFVYDNKEFKEIWGKKYSIRMRKQILRNISLYNDRDTIDYNYVFDENGLNEYDYLVVSSIYKQESIKYICNVNLVYTVKHAGLELYNIYKYIRQAS